MGYECKCGVLLKIPDSGEPKFLKCPKCETTSDRMVAKVFRGRNFFLESTCPACFCGLWAQPEAYEDAIQCPACDHTISIADQWSSKIEDLNGYPIKEPLVSYFLHDGFTFPDVSRRSVLRHIWHLIRKKQRSLRVVESLFIAVVIFALLTFFILVSLSIVGWTSGNTKSKMIMISSVLILLILSLIFVFTRRSIDLQRMKKLPKWPVRWAAVQEAERIREIQENIRTEKDRRTSRAADEERRRLEKEREMQDAQRLREEEERHKRQREEQLAERRRQEELRHSRATRESLRVRVPRDAADFEHVCKEWMINCGYAEARVTGPGPDRGLDIVSSHIGAQCKFYANGSVGGPEIQRLHGAAAQNGLRKTYFFHYGKGYTKDAILAAERLEMTLWRFCPDSLTFKVVGNVFFV